MEVICFLYKLLRKIRQNVVFYSTGIGIDALETDFQV